MDCVEAAAALFSSEEFSEEAGLPMSSLLFTTPSRLWLLTKLLSLFVTEER